MVSNVIFSDLRASTLNCKCKDRVIFDLTVSHLVPLNLLKGKCAYMINMEIGIEGLKRQSEACLSNFTCCTLPVDRSNWS